MLCVHKAPAILRPSRSTGGDVFLGSWGLGLGAGQQCPVSLGFLVPSTAQLEKGGYWKCLEPLGKTSM